MTIRISAAHRDALYEHFLDRLSGIGDLWSVVQAGDYGVATRLGREYSDDLRLILDDLKWGNGPGRSITLTTPTDVLERIFGRLQTDVAALQRSEEDELAEVRSREERSRLVAEACRTVLAGLHAT